LLSSFGHILWKPGELEGLGNVLYVAKECVEWAVLEVLCGLLALAGRPMRELLVTQVTTPVPT